ncbi:MFS transporter [Aquisalinus flavus]|uniref:Major facilitator superfamily (MFS) profile domain-containing protein n=1 Tax=Aquisalinus flavus TaxID=1526572 RepID=A0A8J2V4T5_9PROT|nr:MFS transporter [Aquisalinus flavus]MBD0425840.1 MFS transporter [Aquisalinus flavus]UNE48558.1 MFS transporter [Aquisalinus flavus]GGD12825.1 hypothetical protein GCM10011342_22020 [Aquisalinus flavus]
MASPSPAPEHPTGPFFFQRRFLPMWVAFVLGAFTDNMLKQALLIGLTFQALITLPGIADGASIVPVAGALFPLAMLIFSPIAGQVADKYETRSLFRLTKFVEFLLMVLAGAGFLMLGTSLAPVAGLVLVLALFLMGVQSAFFSPVRISAMPKYLTSHELIRANAFCNGGLYTSILLGLLLGGMLIILPGGPVIVALVLALAALAGWLAIRVAPEAAPDDPALTINYNPATLLYRQIGYVIKEPPVIRPLIGIGLFFFISTAVTIAVPVYADETLNADGSVATAIMGLFAIGALVGAVISALLSRGRSGLGFAASAMTVATLASLALYGASAMFDHDGDRLNALEFLSRPDGWLLAGLFMICAAAMGVFTVPLQAAVQRRARAQHRARIMASGNMLNALTAGIGSLSVLFVTGTAMAPHGAFLAIAALQAAVTLYMILRRRSVPQGLYDEILENGHHVPPVTLEAAPLLDADPDKLQPPRV